MGVRTQEKIVPSIARGETHITHAFLGRLIKVMTGFAYHEVDLQGRTCTCRLWKMAGLPCDHACVAIRHVGGNTVEHVDDWFRLNT